MNALEIILLLLFINTFMFSYIALEALKYMNWKRKFRESKNG